MEEKKNTEISERVQKIIEWSASNPNDFAKKLKYGRSQAIYDILNGKAKPSFDFFQKFMNSEFSELVNIEWLISGNGEPKKNGTLTKLKSENPHLIPVPNTAPISKSEELGTGTSEMHGLRKVYGKDNIPNTSEVLLLNTQVAAATFGAGIIPEDYEESTSLQLPSTMLRRGKKHYAFQVRNSSMKPTIYENDYVVAWHMHPSDYDEIRDNYIYVVFTEDGGVVKRILNRLKTRGILRARSDNREHPAYDIEESSIRAILEVKCKLSFNLSNENDDIYNTISQLQERIETIEIQIKK